MSNVKGLRHPLYSHESVCPELRAPLARLGVMNSRSSLVIVAEDELLTRMMAADALMSAGFTVIEAGHADAALMILRSRAVEVCALFTDVNMPGPMDGLGLAQHASATWPWVRLLVASGKAQPTAIDLPKGCRFLPKPYDPDHMVSHIRELTTAR